MEELSLAGAGGVGVGDEVLRRLLRASGRLRLLDLRGCTRVTPRALLELPCAGETPPAGRDGNATVAPHRPCRTVPGWRCCAVPGRATLAVPRWPCWLCHTVPCWYCCAGLGRALLAVPCHATPGWQYCAILVVPCCVGHAVLRHDGTTVPYWSCDVGHAIPCRAML